MITSLAELRERHVGAALGLRPPRGQHNDAESAALATHAAGRRGVVEIGVLEGPAPRSCAR